MGFEVAREHGLVVFRGRVVHEAQPAVTDAHLERIGALLSGPIPGPLVELWSLCFGGSLDYDLEVELDGRLVAVSFRELFYPGSDHYRDLYGWIENEQEVAEEAAEEQGHTWSGKLDYLPFGGFEYLQRLYVCVKPGPDHGTVIYYRRGLPPAWNDPGGVTRIADDLYGLFDQLALNSDPRDVAPDTYPSGEEVLAAIRELDDPTLAASLEQVLLSARLDWAPALQAGELAQRPKLARLAVEHALDRDDADLVRRLHQAGVDLANLVVYRQSPVERAVLTQKEAVALALIGLVDVPSNVLANANGRSSRALVEALLAAGAVLEVPFVGPFAQHGNPELARDLAARLLQEQPASLPALREAVDALADQERETADRVAGGRYHTGRTEQEHRAAAAALDALELWLRER